MVRPFPLCWAAAAALLALGVGPARAAAAAGPKSLAAVRATGAIDVDGDLSDAAWAAAVPVSDFVQQDPHVNEPASEHTEVRVLVDNEALYFAIRCDDSQPDRIIARERRRDNTLAADDRFEIVLDTFHDHRNGYHFVTNPLGTQYDAMITDEGQDNNVDWNERWWSATRITSQGWTAEIKFPLTTMRSDETVDTYGVNFKRFIRRKNEIAQWTGWDRDFTFLQVSQAGHLTGLAGLHTGLKLRIKPYLLGGVKRGAAPSGTSTSRIDAIGLETMRFSLTPALTAEITANTDFAQTEVDDAVVNLTRFPVFFPEKREFFLERAGIFEFGLGGRRGGQFERNLQMFFSRRIGLTDDRQPVPMRGGGKLVGHGGGFDIGLLNVQTGDHGGRQGSNYTVFRAKRNVFARSNLGLFTSNRQSSGSDYNRVLGGDANFTLFKNTDVQGFLAKSWTPDVSRGTFQDFSGRAKYNWMTDIYEVFVEHLYVGENFQHDVGYVRRRGVRRSDALFVWEPRPKDFLGIRNFVVRSEVTYLTNTHNVLQTREQIVQGTARWQTDDAARANVTRTFDRLRPPFAIARGVTIPAGDYLFTDRFFEVEGSSKRHAAGRLRYGYGDFYGGTRQYVQVAPGFKPSSVMSLEASYEYNEVSLKQGAFTTHVLNARMNLNLSNRWLTTTLAQYDSASKRHVAFFRVNYIYRPGDNLFFVFNRTSDRDTAGRPPDYQVMIKLTRSIDF